MEADSFQKLGVKSCCCNYISHDPYWDKKDGVCSKRKKWESDVEGKYNTTKVCLCAWEHAVFIRVSAYYQVCYSYNAFQIICKWNKNRMKDKKTVNERNWKRILN